MGSLGPKRVQDSSRYDIFVTCQEHELKLKELRSVFVPEKKPMEKRSRKEKISDGLSELRSYVKRHIRIRRKSKPTKVKEVNILPEDDGETWARKSANSAISRSSIDSALSRGGSAGSSGKDKIEELESLQNIDDDEIPDYDDVDDVDDDVEDDDIESIAS